MVGGFDSPELSQPQESRRGEGEYAFKANSGRLNISLFVENPGGPGRTHRDCYEFYWTQSGRNPRIAKDTVQSSEATRVPIRSVKAETRLRLKSPSRPWPIAS